MSGSSSQKRSGGEWGTESKEVASPPAAVNQAGMSPEFTWGSVLRVHALHADAHAPQD